MAQEEKNKQTVSFKDTLNLPRTDFPIRPNAQVNDPALLARWKEEDLYSKSFEQNKGEKTFILHDGPPYANGNIHLGHAYNKILKDIVTKSQRMSGKHVPVTPGWDCHGLPIELKVSKEFPGLSSQALKKECRAYAAKWVDIQRQEFIKLGVVMNWDKPYKTMDYSYEASILRAFGNFVNDGYIEKKKKTVAWCFSCQTVLASAEIEYHERKDPSIYVKFPLLADTITTYFPKLKDKEVSLLVWTTTPWTLPLNRAVLLKPKAAYSILHVNGQYLIVGKELADKIANTLGVEKDVVLEVPAERFEGIKVQHPFITNLLVPIVYDPFVALDEGTACVHCAPGCGPQDYDVALKNNLEIFSPISSDGKYTQEIEPAELYNKSVLDGQGWVIKKLEDTGMLVHKTSIKHNYPHCWRCRNGLIFRATKQWFCNLAKNNLRTTALEQIETTSFLPPKSKNFLKATVEGRLEWCLSRQRTWGVPIPALVCTQCEHAITNQKLIELVAQGVEKEGVEYWDRVSLQELGFSNETCEQCQHSEFKKEQDILDVWFDSGVSHYAVLKQYPELSFPADMYAEGVDQHRGWFQSSLLTGCVLEKQSPTRSFLTHGFTVDKKGQKMSKSLGNVVSPDEVVDQLGTDGLRLWVSSINYDGDAIVSKELFENVQKVYRKIRNTARFLLSNLYDYNHETDAVDLSDMQLIDRYALEELFQVNYDIRRSYEQSNFTSVFHALGDYCTVELSQFYLDIIKDRLYVEQADGHSRRSAQTACWYILDTLTRLMAPVLSFTAELISDEYQKNKKDSIHLQSFVTLPNVWRHMGKLQTSAPVVSELPSIYYGGVFETIDHLNEFAFIAERNHQWQLLRDIRDAVLKAIEMQREQGLIKHPLEAQVTLYHAFIGDSEKRMKDFINDLSTTGQTIEEFLSEFFIVSQVHIAKAQDSLGETGVKGLYVSVERAIGEKCPRCWKYDTTTHEHNLCSRCQKIVK